MKTKLMTNVPAIILALAISLNSIGSVTPGLPVEVKYAGTENYFSVVQVTIHDNTQRNPYTISVKNEYGTIVYSENVTAGSISQRFLFDTDELNDKSVTIEVRNRKTDEVAEYKISSTIKYSQEITSSKLK